jgi:hypothetical protein
MSRNTVTTPEFEHFTVVEILAIDAVLAVWSEWHAPMEGKSGGIVSRSTQAALEM